MFKECGRRKDDGKVSKKQKELLNIKDLAFFNENMQVEKSVNICFGMITEWPLCS